MMDFMDSLKRGVDRAGFEVDRLLRANRVRSRINTLRSQIDEEMRQTGYRVFELCQQGDITHPELRERCDRVKQYQNDMAAREVELEGINREAPEMAQDEFGTSQPTATTVCPSCGAWVSGSAVYCPQCGVKIQAARIERAEPEQRPASSERAEAAVENDDL